MPDLDITLAVWLAFSTCNPQVVCSCHILVGKLHFSFTLCAASNGCLSLLIRMSELSLMGINRQVFVRKAILNSNIFFLS